MRHHFYSQSGEDIVLAALLPFVTGTFAEIGCIDGLRFSNSYHFEVNGWTGLCVEAHPDYLPRLRENRPGSIVVHAAVADHDADSAVFFANQRGSLSTLDPAKEPEFRHRFKPWFSGFTPVRVPMRRLSTILDENDIAALDFVSIDVEGSELGVLQGIDFSRHRPRVFVIEADSQDELVALNAFLIPHAYRFIGMVAHNAYFAEQSFLIPLDFDLRDFEGSLYHFAHPLDDQVAQVTHTKVAWQSRWPDI